jgi:hypothetical protein
LWLHPSLPITTAAHATSAAKMDVEVEDDDDNDDANQKHAMVLCHNMPEHQAISASRATSHFVVHSAHAINIRKGACPIINIMLMDSTSLQSTQTCNLDTPWLPHEATIAHIIPGLAHASLISTHTFWDAGYTIAFDAALCTISK